MAFFRLFGGSNENESDEREYDAMGNLLPLGYAPTFDADGNPVADGIVYFEAECSCGSMIYYDICTVPDVMECPECWAKRQGI